MQEKKKEKSAKKDLGSSEENLKLFRFGIGLQIVFWEIKKKNVTDKTVLCDLEWKLREIEKM